MASKQIHRAVAAALALSSAPLALAGSIEFSPAPFPLTDTEKRSILTADSAIVDGMQVPLGYNTILRSGQTAGSGTFGLLHDINGNPLMAEDGSSYISSDNDFASILEGEDGKLYMVSHFEARPGAMYITELSQNAQTGVLSAVQTRPLDFSAFNGGWVHCAGSVTPWGTHLGSEEYEPDAKQWRDNNIDDYNAAMATYFGATPAQASTVMNPYDYGYPVEVKVNNFNDATVAKHYAMGRIALELGYVMPDNKTVYMSDDGTNVGLFRFVADTAGDLSSGALWVARWNQKTAASAGAADLDWIYLGKANNAQVRQWIDAYQFADIFDEADPIMDGEEDTGRCPTGFKSINAGHQSGDHQCLKIRDVDGDGLIWQSDWNIASRLETRRWAAMQGGTTEFRKMEGITHDTDRNRVYLAISETDRGMLSFNRAGKTPPYVEYDIGGPNHMTIAKGNKCGTVYAMSLDGTYTATNIYPVISGTPMTEDYGAAADSPEFDGNNKCDINGIANPDNITYMPGYNTLIIGEDTGSGHQNDMIWAYNINSKSLTRIQTTPYGSETTSPYFYPDIKGFAYLMSVVQHPYGESDSDMLEQPSEAFGYTGHFVFPAMTD